MTAYPLPQQVTAALRSRHLPTVFEALDRTGLLAVVWPQLAPSVETAGFRDSAHYMADMATEAIAESYEPADILTPATLDAVAATLDLFHTLQPQTLLICAALVEALDCPRVGGQGRVEPRITSPRETAHLATVITLAPPDAAPLPEVAAELQTPVAPDLYRAVASTPGYLDAVWPELQHLAAFPPLRRRARAFYYYARSASRFLAVPLEASVDTLQRAGLTDSAISEARVALDAALPETAAMLIHCAAMRAGLGITGRLLPPRP